MGAKRWSGKEGIQLQARLGFCVFKGSGKENHMGKLAGFRISIFCGCLNRSSKTGTSGFFVFDLCLLSSQEQAKEEKPVKLTHYYLTFVSVSPFVIEWDRDFSVKKGGMARLKGKIGSMAGSETPSPPKKKDLRTLLWTLYMSIEIAQLSPKFFDTRMLCDILYYFVSKDDSSYKICKANLVHLI